MLMPDATPRHGCFAYAAVYVAIDAAADADACRRCPLMPLRCYAAYADAAAGDARAMLMPCHATPCYAMTLRYLLLSLSCRCLRAPLF